MLFLGDFPEDSTIRFAFTTNAADGGRESFSATLEEADIVIFKDGVAMTLDASTITISNDIGSRVGVHTVSVDMSNDADFTTGSDYYAILYASDETLDAQAPAAVLAQWSCENRVVDVARWDGAVLTDPSAPATQAQVDGIGAASGGSINFKNSGDNVDSAIKSISFDGVETSGTNASVNFETASYHQIDDVSNNIDIVYEFDIGGGRTAVELTWRGRIVGTNDELLFKVYNGSTWDTVKTRQGRSNSAPTAVADNFSESIPLFSTHTGTGADSGKVYVRLECVSQSNPTLYTDLLTVAAVNIGQSIGYANGSGWLDTGASNTDTEDFVDGVADNPSSTIAALKTIIDSVGLKRITSLSGSSFTLAATMDGYELLGVGYTLNLGSQSIAGTFIEGATIAASTATAATPAIFSKCIFDANVTLPPLVARNCFFGDATITLGAGDYYFNNCIDRATGSAAPNFDFGGAVGDTNLNLHGWAGGAEFENMGGTGTDTAVLSGNGQLIINANCTGGTITLIGTWEVEDNTNGAVKILETNTVAHQVHKGTAQAGTANTITLASTASATDGAYDPSIIQIVSGPGVGESRAIIDYNGTTKVAVVGKDFRTTPTTASSYVIYSAPGNVHVNEGLAQGGGASSITLNSAASSQDDIYIGQTVFVVGGTGQDEARIVTAYNGTTKVATVHKAWTVQPDSTSSYLMLPTANGDRIEDIRTVTEGLDVYHADIKLNIDETNSQDEYTVRWFLNGERVTSGITTPLIQVIKRVDGTDLIASTAMTQIGTTGAYRYDEATNRVTAGEDVEVVATATIDSSARTFAAILGRDS